MADLFYSAFLSAKVRVELFLNDLHGGKLLQKSCELLYLLKNSDCGRGPEALGVCMYTLPNNKKVIVTN